jgi:hypothetical protein
MEVNHDINREIPVLDWESHLAERTKNMKSSARASTAMLMTSLFLVGGYTLADRSLNLTEKTFIVLECGIKRTRSGNRPET